MKKSLAALALCLALALSAASAQEEIEIPGDMAPKAIPAAEELESEADIVGEMKDSLRSKDTKSGNVQGLSIPATTDLVSVADDGTLTVQTDNLSMSVLPPFGTMAFGQDALAQLDVYSMFEDPGIMVSLLQEVGAHICVVDLSSFTQIYATTSEDAVSAIVEDIDAVDDGALQMLLSAVQRANPDADVSLVTCGGNNFIVFDYRRTGKQMMIYTSVKDNTNIDFVMLPGGDEITDMEISTVESVLSGTHISAI